MNAREILSYNLKKFIDSKGIDQKMLSEQLEISEMSISNWVNGAKYPRMDNIQRLADYFGVLKSDLMEMKENSVVMAHNYTYFPTAISAGLPLTVDAITESEQINIPDSLLGKWAGDKNIFFAKTNGDSMDKDIPDQSLIAIKPIPLESLKNGDIVVFSNGGEYSVKYFYQIDNKLIFKPNSTNKVHFEQHYDLDADIKIHGKVVTYIVNME